MTIKISNEAPYLRTSRNFPTDPEALNVEINRSYVDIAQKVNERVIGIFGKNRPSITGESWFLDTGKKQQSLRQIYNFTSAGSISHGITWASVAQISAKSYGSFTDGTNWYGAIYSSNVAINGQISFYVTPTNIVVIAGAGAPAIVNGLIVLEWLSQI